MWLWFQTTMNTGVQLHLVATQLSFFSNFYLRALFTALLGLKFYVCQKIGLKMERKYLKSFLESRECCHIIFQVWKCKKTRKFCMERFSYARLYTLFNSSEHKHLNISLAFSFPPQFQITFCFIGDSKNVHTVIETRVSCPLFC